VLQIVLLPQVIEDLDEIEDPMFSRLLKKIQLLAEFPQLGSAMVGSYIGYRCLVVDFFRIVYRVIGNKAIEVAYVRHGRRAKP